MKTFINYVAIWVSYTDKRGLFFHSYLQAIQNKRFKVHKWTIKGFSFKLEKVFYLAFDINKTIKAFWLKGWEMSEWKFWKIMIIYNYQITVWQLPDVCLKTTWWLPDDCLMIVLWLSDNHLNDFVSPEILKI